MSPLIILSVGLIVVLGCIIVLRLHAFLSLLLAALVVGALTSTGTLYDYAIYQGMTDAEAQSFASQILGKRLANAFGNTCAKVGILIAMASIIGTALLKSGGAEQIVRKVMTLFGKKNVSLAFLTGSFTLAIPVYFDTVFYLMIPIVKSLSVRRTKEYALFIMCVVAGGVMAHSLVPPTPGPLFVAEELGVDLGVMMLVGILVGLITVFAGYIYAIWANKRWSLPLRDTEDTSIKELESFTAKSDSDLPAFGWAILPIVLPIILIAGNTVLQATLGKMDTISSGTETFLSVVKVLGDSNLALTLSALIALNLLRKFTPDRKRFTKFVGSSLSSAGVIILITSAGGALGGMLQQTGIGMTVQEMAANYKMAVLPLAFVATAVVRTAQGSATVAMITAIGILSSLADSDTLGFHPVYLAIAIGCGSKIFPWMNDSGFWIVTKMSGMEESDTIKYFSFLLTVMGFTGLVAVMILAKLIPLV